ncbi:MAG: helix-turn-helix domain-containing protein [Chitinophagaceae bacterium]
MASVEINDVFDLAFRFITETNESVFLTGKAGTGKTTFLKYLVEYSSKNMVVAAPTGVAAINAGGVTLHSLFQLPFFPFLPTNNHRQELLSKIRYQKQRIQLLRKIELLVIDEISMVRCDVLDAIDTILRSVRRNHESPFGGVQVLFIGDLYQLPPVVSRNEWDEVLSNYYESPFFFDSNAVKEQMPLLIELNTIYRQKEESFVSLLNKVRNNLLEKDDYDQLNLRFIPDFQPAKEDKYITLTSHNNQADQINLAKRNKLDTPSFTYKAIIEDEFPENLYPAEADLMLKEGMQVMFIKNDTITKKYYNGKIGIVSSLSTNKITVNCDGEEIEVFEETWENTRYTLNQSDEKLEQKTLGRFIQYPLRMAWAITIHKSQGLTFEKVLIDAASSFSSGQVYVALSRCTSLEGIVLLSKIQPNAIHSNQKVVEGQRALAPKGSLAERFQGARQIFTQQLLGEIFLLEEAEKSTVHLKNVIDNNKSKLNENASEWIEGLLDEIKKHKLTAEKFLSQVSILLRENAVIENNDQLQQRVKAAAAYFLPLVEAIKRKLQQHPLLTEHRETATTVDEALHENVTTWIRITHGLQYCNSPFSITGYLKHKLNLSLPRIHISSYAANKKSTPVADIPNAELYFNLKNWRDKTCNEQDLPIYLVANNNSLKEIATYLPKYVQDLQLISGFGKAKSEKYGAEILEMVGDYCTEHDLESNIELKEPNPKRKQKERKAEKVESKIPSAHISMQLYKERKDINAIAKERNLATSTVEGHLMDFIKTGDVTIDAFADATTVRIIAECLNANPDKTHSEVRAMLNNAYSFAQIRAVANYLIWEENKNEVLKVS